MRAGMLALLSVGLLAGCAALEPPPPREIAGPTDGYTPTASFLKLHVEREDGTIILLDFDRREWHASAIARRVEQRDLEFVSAFAQPRDILGEYIVRSIFVPEDLQELRYETMGATAEERALMDAEYEELLNAHLAPPSPPSPPPDPLEAVETL